MAEILQHKHLIVKAELLDPPYLPHEVRSWMKKLVDKINMNVMMGPYAAYCDMPGNRGLTGVAVIETSHIALHVWDENSPALAQLDVYTCSDLNVDDVFEALQEFKPTKIEYKYLDREHDLVQLDAGVIYVNAIQIEED